MNGSTFTGFRYHADELQKSTVSSATSAGILSGEEPPPYHEVVRQRKDYRCVILFSNFSLLVSKKRLTFEQSGCTALRTPLGRFMR